MDITKRTMVHVLKEYAIRLVYNTNYQMEPVSVTTNTKGQNVTFVKMVFIKAMDYVWKEAAIFLAHTLEWLMAHVFANRNGKVIGVTIVNWGILDLTVTNVGQNFILMDRLVSKVHVIPMVQNQEQQMVHVFVKVPSPALNVPNVR